MPDFENADALKAAVGQSLGHSNWLQVEQDRINKFADATDDHQWIHVDVERARQGTLSLVSHFLSQVMSVSGAKMGVNYGCNKVRFPAPVPVGSRIRGSGELVEAQEIPGGIQVVVRVSVEVEGGAKPACVADTVSRFLFDT
jgi:acyl dehydratase